MTEDAAPRVISVTETIHAPAATIFELIADPARQPEWDGNANLLTAPAGQRVHAVGDEFAMSLHKGTTNYNRIIEFEEGRRIAWQPHPEGEDAPGHVWKWEIAPVSANESRVTHTYDWTNLHDERREARARATGEEQLAASLTRLKQLAESL